MSKRKVRRWQVRVPAPLRVLLCACAALGWVAAMHEANAQILEPYRHQRFQAGGNADAAQFGDDWVTVSAGPAPPPGAGGLRLETIEDIEPYASPFEACGPGCDEVWAWHMLPDGLIYRSYLAGARESRISSFWAHEQEDGWLWDVALGGRVGLLRFGTADDSHPDGWQLDVEGAGLPRLSIDDDLDVTAVDFRIGVPLTYGRGAYQMKLAYYHISSHLGDEFVLANPGFARLNFVRDVLVWGHSYYVTPAVRVYGEAGWAFKTDGGTEPWEFQFGIDFSPPCPTGFRGAPFAAFNAHLREEVDFGGNFVVQAGWAWRGPSGGHLVRAGVEYFNGKDEQFSFFDESQQKLGFGLWYDF